LFGKKKQAGDDEEGVGVEVEEVVIEEEEESDDEEEVVVDVEETTLEDEDEITEESQKKGGLIGRLFGGKRRSGDDEQGVVMGMEETTLEDEKETAEETQKKAGLTSRLFGEKRRGGKRPGHKRAEQDAVEEDGGSEEKSANADISPAAPKRQPSCDGSLEFEEQQHEPLEPRKSWISKVLGSKQISDTGGAEKGGGEEKEEESGETDKDGDQETDSKTKKSIAWLPNKLSKSLQRNDKEEKEDGGGDKELDPQSPKSRSWFPFVTHLSPPKNEEGADEDEDSDQETDRKTLKDRSWIPFLASKSPPKHPERQPTTEFDIETASDGHDDAQVKRNESQSRYRLNPRAKLIAVILVPVIMFVVGIGIGYAIDKQDNVPTVDGIDLFSCPPGQSLLNVSFTYNVDPVDVGLGMELKDSEAVNSRLWDFAPGSFRSATLNQQINMYQACLNDDFSFMLSIQSTKGTGLVASFGDDEVYGKFEVAYDFEKLFDYNGDCSVKGTDACGAYCSCDFEISSAGSFGACNTTCPETVA
jgi:hypothetical protein